MAKNAFFSTKSQDYIPKINELEKPEYQSQYGSLISDTLGKILNKEKFSYDFNADPLFQQYKQNYTKLGNEAAMNAAAAASSLTGGYGNSYAGTAAAQANQQYLTQLNDKIPELYDAALKKNQMETEELYNQYAALQSEENRLYGMHRNEVADYYQDYGNLQQGYSTALQQEDWQADYDYRKNRDAVLDAQWQAQFDYTKERDAKSDSQWERQFSTSNDQWNKTYDYQAQRDAVADNQWQQEFDTKNAQWQKEYELALKKAKSGGSGSGSGSGGAGSKLSSKLSPYYEKALQFADATKQGDINRVDKYLNQLVQQGLVSESEAYKVYKAVLEENPYFADLIDSQEAKKTLNR